MEGYASEYSQGRMDGTTAVVDFGLSEAQGMVDFLMELDNKAIYGLGFARSVSEALLDSLS